MPIDKPPRIAAPWTLRPRYSFLLLLVLVPAVVGLDYLVGAGLSMRLLYFLFTGLAAWLLGRKGGIAVAVVSAAFAAFLNTQARAHGASTFELAWDGVSNLALLLIFAFVVARHRRSIDGVLSQARIDLETGLLSRREFERLLESEVKRSERYKRPVALMLIECSGLKGGAGIAVLAVVGRAAQQLVREGDSIGREGEQRLGVILLECKQETAGQVVTRIRARLEEALQQKLRTGSLALGLVSYGGESKSSSAELLMLADAQVRFAHGEKGVSTADTSVQ